MADLLAVLPFHTLDSPLFAYELDTDAKARAKLFDGKLVLVTNTKNLKPGEVIDRYKGARADRYRTRLSGPEEQA